MIQIQGDERKTAYAMTEKKEEQQTSNRAKSKRRGYQVWDKKRWDKDKHQDEQELKWQQDML